MASNHIDAIRKAVKDNDAAAIAVAYEAYRANMIQYGQTPKPLKDLI